MSRGTGAAEKALPTFAALASRYQQEYAALHHKPYTRRLHASLLKVHILPVFGELKLPLRRADVARLHGSLAAHPTTANAVARLTSGILNWAEKAGELPPGSNPYKGLKRYALATRERLISASELAKLGEVLEANAQTRPRSVAIVRLLMFTGARVGEICSLRWDAIHRDRGVARLSDSKTGPKNVFLPPAALAVLDTVPKVAGSPYCFPAGREGGHTKDILHHVTATSFWYMWEELRREAGLENVHAHDLRHLVASVAAMSGDSLFIVAKLLGHASSAMTERYSHLAPNTVGAVAHRTSSRIAAMLTGQNSAPLPATTDTMINWPTWLVEAVNRAAAQSGRNVGEEIIQRLERSFMAEAAAAA